MAKETLGSFIREARQNLGLSLRDLASLLKVDHSYICKLENNKAIPSHSMILSLSKHLQVNPAKLEFLCGIIPQEFVEKMVMSAYFLGEITEGHGMILLGVDRMKFRELYQPYRERFENAQKEGI